MNMKRWRKEKQRRYLNCGSWHPFLMKEYKIPPYVSMYCRCRPPRQQLIAPAPILPKGVSAFSTGRDDSVMSPENMAEAYQILSKLPCSLPQDELRTLDALKTSAWSSLNFGDGTKATESERPLSMAGTREKNTLSDITFLCKCMHPLPFSVLLILIPNAFFLQRLPL